MAPKCGVRAGRTGHCCLNVTQTNGGARAVCKPRGATTDGAGVGIAWCAGRTNAAVIATSGGGGAAAPNMAQAEGQDGSCPAGAAGPSIVWSKHRMPAGSANATGTNADSRPCIATA